VTFDDAVDELYGAALEEFVAVRNRLAKELGGDEGKQLATLRKPNIAAWTLNQLARQSRREVDLLLDAGHRMRQAGVEREAFQQARAKEADALKRLTKAAEELGVSAAVIAKVNAALRAAAVSEQGRELLARGRFVDLPTASGFEAYEGVELPKPATKPRATTADRKHDARREAATALREAEKKLREAEREVERAEKTARAARAAADAAAADVDAAERRLRKLG
jgi:hypothetical protein